MKNVILVVIGLGCLGFGGYRQFVGAAVSDADRGRCEAAVQAQNGDSAEALALLLPKCADPGMVAMTDAQVAGDDASAAAQRIAAANQADSGAHLVDWALIGIGLVAFALAGAATLRRRAA